jgi:hypothetical protein
MICSSLVVAVRAPGHVRFLLAAAVGAPGTSRLRARGRHSSAPPDGALTAAGQAAASQRSALGAQPLRSGPARVSVIATITLLSRRMASR